MSEILGIAVPLFTIGALLWLVGAAVGRRQRRKNAEKYGRS